MGTTLENLVARFNRIDGSCGPGRYAAYRATSFCSVGHSPKPEFAARIASTPQLSRSGSSTHHFNRIGVLVWCPNCKADYLSASDSAGAGLRCPKCQARFPVSEGVADLIPNLKFERGRAQALMESPTMARIYAGRLWRRSFWQGALLGIQFEREAALIIQAAQVQPTSTVLDLACASGIYTRIFAEAAPEGRVVGLDLSMPMLKVAAGLEEQLGRGNITYLRGSAQALPFADSAFDCVNCCGALHLFPDPNGALAEISRVTKPGGRFTVGTFRRREGTLGRASLKTAKSIGVNMFTPEGLLRSLAAVGLTDVRIHHDAARWMILSGTRG